MSDYRFPSEIPEVGALIRITPVRVDQIVRHYKDFCEEAHVVSRFRAVNYEGAECCIEVYVGGEFITKLFYNQSKEILDHFF